MRLGAAFGDLVTSPPWVGDSDAQGQVTLADLRLVESARHFDSQLSASIGGWLDHNLGLHGFGVGTHLGGLGLNLGTFGLSGQSQAHLSVDGTARDNLVGEGFMAVFERRGPDGQTDTVRLVVPPEAVAREMLAQVLSTATQAYIEGSHAAQAVTTAAPHLMAVLPAETSHVSDRLSLMSKTGDGERFGVSVAGVEISTGVLLGAAIKLEPDGAWSQLFPLPLMRRVEEAIGASPPVYMPALMGSKPALQSASQ